jgi:hypothetical protein
VQSGAVREIGQRPPWSGSTRGSRGGGRNWHSNSVSILRRSPAINITSVFLLVATAAVWLPGTAATAVDVCGNGRMVQEAGTNSQMSVSSDFLS